MSETVPSQPSDSLLHSDVLFRVLGGDAMQILRCGICMEFFDVPIVLPCGHTFCLQCLTEMCKHASRNCVLSPLKDLRIGCPNCRVLIYASPILERNVTCNFIIQSFIECLRARDGRQRLSTGVNTDEVRVGPKIRAVSDLEIQRVIKEVDRLTDSLGKRNVLDNAYFEVDEIRRQYLADEAKRQEEEEEQLKHKTWNQNRGTHVVSSQLRHQQPFLQQRSRPFTWDLINNQSMTLSSSSPFQQQLSIQQPSLQQPGLQQPSLQQHSLQQPCLQQQLGLQQHSLQQQLSLQQPNLQQPNLQQPGLQQSGLQQPGLQQPGLQQPGLQQPGLQQPGLQQPGLQQPQRPTQYPNQLQQQAHPPPQSAHPPQQTVHPPQQTVHPPQQTVHPPQQTVHSLPPPPTSQNQQAVQPNACRLSQQQQVPPNLCRISKMATVLPLQRCPDVGHGSGQQMEAHSRLDNDPAIMSYSYKAAAAAAGNK